ncbi:MAG TPA: hypothetical protein VFD70_07965 [Anaerolineae bacterium]|nr:hypothetical protein [Anaerolineae bacterium]
MSEVQIFAVSARGIVCRSILCHTIRLSAATVFVAQSVVSILSQPPNVITLPLSLT